MSEIGLDFEILVHGCFRAEQLDIRYDPALTMPSDPAVHAWMDALWEEKLIQARSRQVPLYDAPLFRLVSAEARGPRLGLVLGNTGYKEYVTTREPAFASAHTRQELGNALGVCSVVETDDGHILLDRRVGVDVYAGRYHVIGGFFERTIDINQQGCPDPFAAIRREIHEETGVLSADIAAQFCFGAVYDLLTPHAELCFLTQLRIPLATVFTRTPLDREIKQLHSLEVNAGNLRDFIQLHRGNISATGEANMRLYGTWKFGKGWLEEIPGDLLPRRESSQPESGFP